MKKLIEKGKYKLIETAEQTKILSLENNVFAWVDAKGIGEILVSTHKPHDVDHILALGEYRIYEVKDEPELTDLPHLELSVGEGVWQGYLLTTGLPNDAKTRSRIIPTQEVVTKE